MIQELINWWNWYHWDFWINIELTIESWFN